MSNYGATINKIYNIHDGSFLSHVITLSQTERTFSTVEFTCNAVHSIQGEIFDDLHFNIYRKLEDGTLLPLFYSELNPVNKTILSENSGEYSKFAENNFKLIIEDIGIEEGVIDLIFKISSENSKFNYTFNENNDTKVAVSYSTFITNPVLPSGKINIEGVSLSTNIANFFTKEINLVWPAATYIVTTDNSNGYILSHSLDEGNSWNDTVITNLSPINGECRYKFNIENFAPDACLMFRVCCFNDLKMTSNYLYSDVIFKCDIEAADLNITIYDKDNNILNNYGVITNEASKIILNHTGAKCINKNNQILPNQQFIYSIDFLNDFIINEGNIERHRINLGNANTLEINIVESLDSVEENKFYILRERLLEALDGKLVNNLNFILRSTLNNYEDNNIIDSITLNTESIIRLNLFNYTITPAYDLIIFKDASSSAYNATTGCLLPDGENFIKLVWKKAENVNNTNDSFLYDIYIGIDGIYTYENTTTNTFYDYKMEKVDKATALTFYIVARNKYTSIKSEISQTEEIHYYNRSYLNTFNIERTKETCNIKFSFIVDSSIPNIGIGFLYLDVDGNSNNIEGLPAVTFNNPIQINNELSCRISKLNPTSSYTLTLNYRDTSNLSDSIIETFRIPSASPIMEVTPSCITMGGAEVVNNKILNVKGDVAINGKLEVATYQINSLRDNINSFVNSGNYTCDLTNAEAMSGQLPFAGPFNMVVVGGFCPIQFLMYTINLGDNHIYMRTMIDNNWSEWVLIHQVKID